MDLPRVPRSPAQSRQEVPIALPSASELFTPPLPVDSPAPPWLLPSPRTIVILPPPGSLVPLAPPWSVATDLCVVSYTLSLHPYGFTGLLLPVCSCFPPSACHQRSLRAPWLHLHRSLQWLRHGLPSHQSCSPTSALHLHPGLLCQGSINSAVGCHRH